MPMKQGKCSTAVEAELRVLRTYDSIDYDEPQEFGQSGDALSRSEASRKFLHRVHELSAAEKLSCSTMFQNMDFSVFGRPPSPTIKLTSKIKVMKKSRAA